MPKVMLGALLPWLIVPAAGAQGVQGMHATPAVAATELADAPSQCSGASNHYGRAFFDDFAGTSLDPDRWSVNANDGIVTVADHSVTLAGSPAFPYVVAIGSPIPVEGEFSVRWIAAYGPQSVSGTSSLSIAYEAPPNGSGTWTSAADAWQDFSGYRVRALVHSDTNVDAYTDKAPESAQHDVEYCWLQNSVEIYVDGVLRLQQSRDASVQRPRTLWFGSPDASPGEWQSFTLYSVEVRAIGDSIFKSGFES